MPTNVAANKAMTSHVGVNTGTKSPTTTRMHGPIEVGTDAEGSVWVYGKANAALSAGTIGYDTSTVAGQGTLKSGTGYTVDKAVASGEWYWAKKATGIS